MTSGHVNHHADEPLVAAWWIRDDAPCASHPSDAAVWHNHARLEIEAALRRDRAIDSGRGLRAVVGMHLLDDVSERADGVWGASEQRRGVLRPNDRAPLEVNFP